MRVFARGGDSESDPTVAAAAIAAIEAFMEQETAQAPSRRTNEISAWRRVVRSGQPQFTFGANRSWRGIN
ncbi:MAG TPA: hypothetical protein DCP37_06685 [Dehalococcoidia bacterium]|nr:hypothetical protein [SAR202 cluster bacterium]MDP6662970.1 hypothetical protein [SAR202 cluster bacterium]HAL47425.1 hypothetical protein [Dehalococcoidia bacterium]